MAQDKDTVICRVTKWETVDITGFIRHMYAVFFVVESNGATSPWNSSVKVYKQQEEIIIKGVPEKSHNFFFI